MSESMLNKRLYLILSLIASIISFLLLANWPQKYYFPLLRTVMFCFAMYVAYAAYQWEKNWAAWLFGVIASLRFTIDFDSRELWQLIDIICAVLFAVIAFILKKPVEEKNVPRQLRKGFGTLALVGILALCFSVGSIDTLIRAKTNCDGGYIYNEYTGDEWYDAAEYKRHERGEGIVMLSFSVGGWVLFCLMVRENLRKTKSQFLQKGT